MEDNDIERLNVLCFNAKGECVMLSTCQPIEEEQVLEVQGKTYQVTEIRDGIVTLGRKNGKVVDLKVYREKK